MTCTTAGRPPRSTCLAVTRRDRQREPGAAALEERIDLPGGGHRVGRRRSWARPRSARSAPGSRRAVAVGDDHRHVADVGRGRVAKHRELEDRRDDHQPEQPRVPPQLLKLLAHEKARRCMSALLPRAGAPRPGSASPWRRSRARRAAAAGGDRRALQHDAAERDQEVARRHEIRDELQRARHAADRKDEPGQHDRRQERDEQRQLKRDLLRVGDRRDQEARWRARRPGRATARRAAPASSRASAVRTGPWTRR